MVRNIAKLRKIILPLILMTMIISVLGYIQPDTSTTTNSTNVTNESDPIAMANISSNYADWSDEYNDAWLNSSYGKINKTGDNFTGSIYMNKYNLTNSSNVQANHVIGAVLTTATDIKLIPDGGGSNYIGQFQSEDNSASVTFLTASGTVGHTNVFSGIVVNGNLSGWTELPQNKLIFAIGFRGSYGYGNGSYNGDIMSTGNNIPSSKAIIYGYTEGGAWNSTSMPTGICIGVTAVGTTTRTNRFCIDNQGDITLSKLAGSGNAYVCTDSTGKLYRGSPTC